MDASVWVNSFDQREEGHQTSRQVMDLLKAQTLSIVVPNLVLVEVAGAISRTRQAPEKAQEFVTALRSLPNMTLVPLDETLVQRALSLAAQHGLRGADAVYAAVAAQYSCTLLTLDNEHLTRLAGIVTTCTPAQTLKDLLPKPSTPESP